MYKPLLVTSEKYEIILNNEHKISLKQAHITVLRLFSNITNCTLYLACSS